VCSGQKLEKLFVYLVKVESNPSAGQNECSHYYFATFQLYVVGLLLHFYVLNGMEIIKDNKKRVSSFLSANTSTL
jgi:hypothetical protein